MLGRRTESMGCYCRCASCEYQLDLQMKSKEKAIAVYKNLSLSHVVFNCICVLSLTCNLADL